uniref:Uncharacterized protein n=1 Tax=Anguilla anguilla TaxID=7936 RepID=A0A0E9R4W3_ANGAN
MKFNQCLVRTLIGLRTSLCLGTLRPFLTAHICITGLLNAC